MALKSVIGQSFQDFDVIVVDNYSDDHTVQVVEEVNDSRFQLIKFRNNGVIGAGRNVGINSTTGAYVAFLDSDDSWFPQKLEKVAEAIKEDPEAGLLCHNQDMIRDGRVIRRTNFGPPPSFRGTLYDYQLQVGNGPATSATVVARPYLDQVGYFSEEPSLISMEDVDLWIRLSKVCAFRFLPEVLGIRQFHTGGVSAQIEHHLRANLTVLDKFYGGINNRQNPYPRKAVRRHYSSIIYNAAREYHRLEASNKSLVHYTRSLMTYPFLLKAYGGLALLIAGQISGQGMVKRLVGALRRGTRQSN